MAKDPELEQVFTPKGALAYGFTVADVHADAECTVYAREVGNERMHFVVTVLHSVIVLTTDRHVAEYASGIPYTCACPNAWPPCINAVSTPGGVCGECAQDNHGGHRGA